MKKVFALTLAASIMANDKTKSRSEAMKSAWAIVNTSSETENIAILTFEKVDGKKCKRVVSENWQDYTVITGTGKTKPENLKLFADVAKHFTGQRCIISTYNVVSIQKLTA